MTTKISIQNVSDLSGDPKTIIIMVNSQFVYLSPKGRQPYRVKRIRIPDAQPRLDPKTGAVIKDIYGNMVTQDVSMSVLVEDPRALSVQYWSKCPEDLWIALQRGTYEHVFTEGEPIAPDLIRKQKWFDRSSAVTPLAFEMKKYRPLVGAENCDLARLEDVMMSLERRLMEEEDRKRHMADEIELLKTSVAEAKS